MYELKSRDQIIPTFKEKTKPVRTFTIDRKKIIPQDYTQLYVVFNVEIIFRTQIKRVNQKSGQC